MFIKLNQTRFGSAKFTARLLQPCVHVCVPSPQCQSPPSDAQPCLFSSSAPQALAKLFDPLVAWMAPRYQAVVGRELRKYGLRYEDLYDPQMDLVSRSCCCCCCCCAAAPAAPAAAAIGLCGGHNVLQRLQRSCSEAAAIMYGASWNSVMHSPAAVASRQPYGAMGSWQRGQHGLGNFGSRRSSSSRRSLVAR